MSGGHRGDAGGDSSNPNTIPTTIKASFVAKRKKMRRISRSENLIDAFEANGKKPLPIQFDLRVDTYNAVGPNANMFTRYIRNLVARGIPSYYLTWDHVPQEFKKSIVPRLRHFFNLDRSLPEWPLILAGIERECQDCYKNRKRKLKRHFDQIGGYHDVCNAQVNPPPKLDHKAWWKTVKLFLDPQYMNRLMKNTETNIPARIDHEAMLTEHAQTPQHDLTLSSSANEARAITNVLGEHCGYDHGLKGSAFSSYFEPPQPPSMPLTYDGMKLFFESINNNMQYLHDLFDTLSRLYPGIYPPPPPPPIIDTEALLASCFPQHQSQRPPQQRDDDDYYGDDDDDDYDDDAGDDDGDDDDDGDGDDGDGNYDDDIYDESDSYDD